MEEQVEEVEGMETAAEAAAEEVEGMEVVVGGGAEAAIDGAAVTARRKHGRGDGGAER